MPLVHLLALVSMGLLFVIFNSKSRSSLFTSPTTSSTVKPPRYIFVSLGVGSGDGLDVFLTSPEEAAKGFPKPEWAEYRDAGSVLARFYA